MPGLVEPQTPPEETPWTVDELIRQRAQTDPDLPLVAYPSNNGQYVDYTARQLDVYAYRAAQQYAKCITPRSGSSEPTKVVGLLGPSDINYLISTLALTKLGMTVLFLSTRISDAAYISLLQATGCRDLLIDPALEKKIARLASQVPNLNVQAIAGSDRYLYPMKDGDLDTAMDHQFDHLVENLNHAWIIHSSGSTGLPKPIYQTHAAALRNYANNFNMRGFITLPLYHAHGISSVFRAIHSKKQIHIYSASLPLTGPVLLDTMRTHQFEILYAVPYALKLLSEMQEGLNVLKKLKLVMFGGSSCPDVLGDKLVNNGVRLISHYGTTETGQLMTSFRDDDDLDWNYLRVSTSLEPFIQWEERGGDLFELVVLDGWPSKVATNRPDGAYATKDLFSRHSTKPNAFKWSGRLDDTLVLLNGEKAVPIPIEHTVRENPFVAEAVVFGAGKPQLGLFVVPAAKTEGMTTEDIMAKIALSIEAANAEQPGYAQITTDMVRVLPRGVQYPRTDKDTVIRAAFYNQFKDAIEQVYTDQLSQTVGGEDLAPEELKAFLRETLLEVMRLENPSVLTDDTDFFALGMDSLQALRIHSAIVKKFNTNGKPVGQNVVFEHPTLDALTTYLHCLRTGESHVAESAEQVMGRLLEKYSTFRPHVLGVSEGRSNAVVVTGATGSLGAHVVARLVKKPTIHRVYCLVRASTAEKAEARVVSSMHQRRVYHSLTQTQRRKISAMPSDFSRSDLGLEPDTYEELLAEVGVVIYLAWAVNFNMGIESFEKQHIAGVHNLIQFCLDSKRPRPAAFHFGSSVSAVAATPNVVDEKIETDFSRAQSMGYAQSKLVAENICSRATQQTGMICRVLRIGQVAGDTEHGVWNATEAIPLMVQSATTIGSIPTLDEAPTWLPVDVVAQAIVELSFTPADAAAPDSVFHIVNPAAFHWTRDFIPSLRAAGLEFEEVNQREWIRRLRASNPDPVANPPFKLTEFFASKYDRDDKRPPLYYRTDIACSKSPALHSAPQISCQLVAKFVKYWQQQCWTSHRQGSKTANVLVIAGPCGTGKSTLAEALAATFGFPWIEADTLHSPAAISKMRGGDPLTDEDRWQWLEKIKRKFVGETVDHAGVIVTCSALKRRYRDVLRDVPSDVAVTFLMLEAEGDILVRRMETRQGHYMKAGMVRSQLQVLEPVGADEVDVIPFDVTKERKMVVREAIGLVRELVFRR